MPRTQLFTRRAQYSCGAFVTLRSDSERALVKAVLDAALKRCPACEGARGDKHVERVGRDIWLTKRTP